MLSNKRANRFYFIDLIKVVSILVIFITHYLMDIGLINNMFNVHNIYAFIERPNIHLGMLSCSMFIICSGFGLSVFVDKKYNGRIDKNNLIDFYYSRLVRVLIPFYIAYFTYFIIRVINQHNIFIFGGVPKWKIIYTIFGIDEYLNANGIRTFSLGIGEWYLGCLILCYLFFPLLYYLSKKLHKITFCLLTVHFFISQFYINNFYIVPHMNFIIQIYNFYLGILLYTSGIIKKNNRLLLLFSILYVLIIYCYPTKLDIYYILICTIFSVSIFIIFSYIEKYIKDSANMISIINIFNKYSYEFFLCHHFVIYQVDFLMKYRSISNKLFILLFLIDLILTFMFSFSINIISNKVLSRIKK